MFRGLILGSSLFFASAIPLFCQFDSGTILGTVYDVSRFPVSEARVALQEVRKGIKLNARSGNSGTFEFLSIPIGRYKLRVEQSGFRPQSSPEFEVTIGARQRVDFTLELESVQSSVQLCKPIARTADRP